MHSCVFVDPKTSFGLMDPENHQRSTKTHEVWVQENTRGFGPVMGPSKHMRLQEGETVENPYKPGSIKSHEDWSGENFDLGPSNHMSF